MLNAYIKDRISWIALYAAALLLTDFLLLLDGGLTLAPASLLYLNGLLIILFAVFFSWRYWKETAYLKSLRRLTEEVTADWQEGIPEADFPLQAVISRLLWEIDGGYRKQLAALQEAVRAEQHETAAWVHEVKAPLTAMKLVIEADRGNPAFRKLETQWLRIHMLVDRQLYISRLPSLEADYVLEETDLLRLAAEEIRQLMPWCLERNIAVDLAEGKAVAVTDRKWCRFILSQLLTNAVKYSRDGGTVTISSETDRTGGLTLSVTDEGPGIPVHEQPRIFDRGFTGSAGRIHNAATGLGLFLARQAADKIGIRLSVQSGKGAGTTMVMVFPEKNEFDAVRM